MYRVELKGCFLTSSSILTVVPNVPCGVESLSTRTSPRTGPLFLMYRVELKASIVKGSGGSRRISFLMYRVELKASILRTAFAMNSSFLMYRVELKDLLEEIRLVNCKVGS